jgi:SanA protein
MYQDRADVAVEVYKAGKAEKILISGDHGRNEYDEVNAARKYLLAKGVPAEDIFLDHAGFDTYDSLYRARDIFQIKTLIISTQNFHLPRAVYIARKMGIGAWGVSADKHLYGNEQYYEMREALARAKAWLDVLFQAEPKFLGEAIPITGDSRASWDEK